MNLGDMLKNAPEHITSDPYNQVKVEIKKDERGGGYYLDGPGSRQRAINASLDKAKKHDNEKLRMDLIPVSSQVALATILTHGATKYGDRNWELGLDWHRPYGALQRHLTAWWAGEDLDKESGKSHLWHAMAELAFLVEYEQKGTGLDDRSKGGQSNGHCIK